MSGPRRIDEVFETAPDNSASVVQDGFEGRGGGLTVELVQRDRPQGEFFNLNSPSLALRGFYELECGTMIPPVQNLVAPNLSGKGFHLDLLTSNRYKATLDGQDFSL